MLLVSPRKYLAALILLIAIFNVPSLHAGELRLSFPKRSKPTPVQKLNQQGVEAVRNQKFEQARKLFYKAYLIDPDDPFTLNNLGYLAEIDGDLDRAQRFYTLSAEHSTEATVYRASDDNLEGKPVSQVAGNATADRQMQINRINVYAIQLLLKDRASEADLALHRAYDLDTNNPFTLNNLGFAKEKQGELEQAMRFYSAAAAANSTEPVVVSVNKNWRGRPISEIARENYRNCQRQLEREDSPEARVARLNLRGVSAINRNERKIARQDFEQAYKLDPNNAFTLNNMGYVAELDGDRETADFFYAKAREADRAGARVAVATRKDMEGRTLASVARVNSDTVQAANDTELAARRRQRGITVGLRRRDNQPVVEPATPPTPAPEEAIRTEFDAAPSSMAAPAQNQTAVPRPPVTRSTVPSVPRPSAEQPAANPGQVLPPLPESQQPAANPNDRTAQPGDILPPLPDNQQPQ